MRTVALEAAPLAKSRTRTAGVLFCRFKNAFTHGVEFGTVKVAGELDELHSEIFPVFHGFCGSGFAGGGPAEDDNIFGESHPAVPEGVFILDQVVISALLAVGKGVKHIVPHVDSRLGGNALDFLAAVAGDLVESLSCVHAGFFTFGVVAVGTVLINADEEAVRLNGLLKPLHGTGDILQGGGIVQTDTGGIP